MCSIVRYVGLHSRIGMILLALLKTLARPSTRHRTVFRYKRFAACFVAYVDRSMGHASKRRRRHMLKTTCL